MLYEKELMLAIITNQINEKPMKPYFPRFWPVGFSPYSRKA